MKQDDLRYATVVKRGNRLCVMEPIPKAKSIVRLFACFDAIGYFLLAQEIAGASTLSTVDVEV
jgi:hypothetical protein